MTNENFYYFKNFTRHKNIRYVLIKIHVFKTKYLEVEHCNLNQSRLSTFVPIIFPTTITETYDKYIDT